MHRSAGTLIGWLVRGIVCISTPVMLTQVPTDVAPYAPLFGVTYHAKSALDFVVRDSFVVMPTLHLQGASAEWRKQFDDVPLALRVAAGRAAPTRARPLDPTALPAGVRMVPAQATRGKASPATTDAWAAFTRQYGANGWLAFSEALLTPDGLDALVYYEAECGGLCGESGYAWLHRDSAQSGWSIKKKIVRRLS